MQTQSIWFQSLYFSLPTSAFPEGLTSFFQLVISDAMTPKTDMADLELGPVNPGHMEQVNHSWD